MGENSASAYPWRVRILDSEGELCGAGFLLSPWHVLTCAHVVRAAGGERAEVFVEFVAEPHRPRAPARVARDGWADVDGDVALLRLAWPAEGLEWANANQRSYRRLAGLPVSIQGFPRDLSDGVWLAATLSGPGGPRGQLVQIDIDPNSRVTIEAGFSGAAVLDPETDQVVGMVVAEYQERRLGWMLPMENIVGYLPAVGPHVNGGSSADQVFRDRTPEVINRLRTGPTNLVSELGTLNRRLTEDPAGDVVNIVGTEADRSPLIIMLVALHDPGQRPRLPEDALSMLGEDMPPPGWIDVAVDAAGRTSSEIAVRIAERIGPLLRRPDRGPDRPVVVVVDSVDTARNPGELLGQVLRPLAEAFPQRLRIVAGSREPLGGITGNTLYTSVSRPPDATNGRSVADRLDGLDTLLDEIDELESTGRARFPELRARVRDVPAPTDLVTRLRLRATRVRRAAELAAPADPRVPAKLAETEERAAHARQTGRALLSRYTELARQPEVLLGLLNAFRDRAVLLGAAEDLDLADHYDRAHRLLAATPCRLSDAERAVWRYVTAVWRRQGLTGEVDG
ncbi:MAG TPA: serine protease [Pseudonocardiaceae bacterium]|jgi:hypothetical protein|nr:serine protease [Pseudonocardiaceae bacterium]